MSDTSENGVLEERHISVNAPTICHMSGPISQRLIWWFWYRFSSREMFSNIPLEESQDVSPKSTCFLLRVCSVLGEEYVLKSCCEERLPKINSKREGKMASYRKWGSNVGSGVP